MSLLTLEPLTRLVRPRLELGPPRGLGAPFDPQLLELAWTPLRQGLVRLAEAARKGGCCLVSGPPGSGKTTLLEAFGWFLEQRPEWPDVPYPSSGPLPWLVMRGDQSFSPLESGAYAGGVILYDGGPPPRALLDLCHSRRLPLTLVATSSVEWGAEDFEHFPTVHRLAWPGRPGEWEGLVARRALEHSDLGAIAAHPDVAYQVSSLVHLDVYKGRPADWLRRQVVEGGYPLHPAALFALPRLSMLASSRERNAFRFFSDPERGGLPYFLNNSTVAQPQGQLSLFTLDGLYGYFAPNLRRQYPEAVAWLESSVAAARDVPLARRLLHNAWLLDRLGHERLPLRPDVLLWSAHLTEKEAAQANRSLKLLIGQGLLHYDAATGRLRLPQPWPGPTADELLRHLGERMPEEFDLFEMLSRQPPPQRLQTFEVNARQHTDRYVRVRLARPEQLEQRGWLEQQVAPCRSAHPYQGDLLLLYLAVHRAPERERLRELLHSGGPYADPHLVLAWPERDYPLAQEARQVRALELLVESRYPFCDPLSPRHSEVEQQLEVARARLNRQVRELLQPGGLEFRCGEHWARNPSLSQFHYFLNRRVMDNLGRPPLIPERLFSRVQRRSPRRLRCLDYLLSSGPTLLLVRGEPDHEPLRAALRSTGVLERLEGGESWEVCHLSPTGGPLGPALGILESHLVGAGVPRHELSAGPALATLAAPPYSLPPSARELLLALLCWRHQGSLRLHGRQPTARQLCELVADPERHRLDYLPIEPEQLDYLAGLATELDRGFVAVEGVDPWKAAARRVMDWFATLSPQSLALGRDRTPFNAALIDLLRDTTLGEGRERWLLEEGLPQALGRSQEEPWSVILDRFRLVRRSLGRALPATRELLHLGLRQIFVSTDPHDQELGWPGLIAAWYARLPRVVRDEPQDDTLKMYLGASVDAEEEESLDDLLGELGYPPTPQWMRDYTAEILERVRLARAEMDYADFLGFYPVPPHLRADTAVELIKRMLWRSELSVEELETVLQGELEQVAMTFLA